MRKALAIGLFLAAANSAADAAPAQTFEATSLLCRNFSYEQALKYEAGIDKSLTPARAFRWFMSLAGRPVSRAPASTEFQPVVGIDNSRIRIVAAIAYKF